MRGMDELAVEKISDETPRGSVPRAHRDDAVGADEGCGDHAASTRLFRVAPDAADDGARCRGARSRTLIYPGQLLSQQGAAREGDVPADPRRASAAGCRTRWRSLLTLPGVGRKTANLVLILSHASREQHLRRHARASHREPARLGADEDARRDRAGAVSGRAAPVVARRQPASGDLGPERLPAGVSALPGVRRSATLCPRIGVTKERRRWTDASASACAAASLGVSAVWAAASSRHGVRADAAARRRGRSGASCDRDREGHDRDPAVPGRRAEERRAHPRAREAELLPRPAHSIASRLARAVRRSAVARHVAERRLLGQRRQRQPDRRGRDLEQATRTCAARSASRTAGDAELRRQPDLHHEDRQSGLDGKHAIIGQVTSGHGRRGQAREGRAIIASRQVDDQSGRPEVATMPRGPDSARPSPAGSRRARDRRADA